VHIPFVEILHDRQAHRPNGLALLSVLETEGASNRVDLGLSHLDDLAAPAARHGDQPDDIDGARSVRPRFGEDAAERPILVLVQPALPHHILGLPDAVGGLFSMMPSSSRA
jgi:hypothetical protein